MIDEAGPTRDNVPIPKHGSGRKHAFEDRYHALKPGQSFDVPYSKENAVRTWLTIYHKLNPEGKRFQTAREGDRLRIWRVDGMPEETQS